jgi:hypothetical protein
MVPAAYEIEAANASSACGLRGLLATGAELWLGDSYPPISQ